MICTVIQSCNKKRVVKERTRVEISKGERQKPKVEKECTLKFEITPIQRKKLTTKTTRAVNNFPKMRDNYLPDKIYQN